MTAEEHQIYGGLSGAVAELLVRNTPVPVAMVGVRDTFGESGTPEELAVRYGLTGADIAAAVTEVLARKRV